MQVHQRIRTGGAWQVRDGQSEFLADLVLVFSSSAILSLPETWAQLKYYYPSASIIGCSTAGEIESVSVFDDSIVCTAVAFEHSQVAVSKAELDESRASKELGELLMSRLPKANLSHVFIVADGLNINGSSLLDGVSAQLPSHVGVTGGLAGDGPRFLSTHVSCDGPSPTKQAIAIGFYGHRLMIHHGSQGGWDAFGVERTITKSANNVLFELDGEPALDLYERYLGDKAIELPASGLRFPLSIRAAATAADRAVVRTILGVDRTARTLTFAGDMPVGFRARLMSANIERLIDGARGAAVQAQVLGAGEPQLAILVSCVGRRLVLKQRVEEELDAVRDVLGSATAMTGFYSYGEISPFTSSSGPQFHNQTMTITTVSER